MTADEPSWALALRAFARREHATEETAREARPVCENEGSEVAAKSSKYERNRASRIEKNKRFLASLGLTSSKAGVKVSSSSCSSSSSNGDDDERESSIIVAARVIKKLRKSTS